MSKDMAIKAIREAELDGDWFSWVFDNLEDRFAAGYLSRRAEELNESLSWEDEGFRELLLEAMDYNIWGK